MLSIHTLHLCIHYIRTTLEHLSGIKHTSHYKRTLLKSENVAGKTHDLIE